MSIVPSVNSVGQSGCWSAEQISAGALALDGSTSNLRTIVASAGYGKTTLAEQWAAVDGRRVGWYRARTSASDVSVVARGLAEAASRIVPEAGRRMLERLAVTGDPDREARLLAEMLASDLQDWPRDGWIVVDDFHHLQAAPDPETFVETLVSDAPVQLLLVGRNRPRWVTARDVLYGDVLEIGRAALAMNADEIDEMLGDDSGPLASGLLAVADGVVLSAGFNGGAGRMIHLRHGNGLETQYLHLSASQVRVGQHVHQGDVIGKVGQTGLATGPHLDYRVRKNGTFVNPVRIHQEMPPGEPIAAADRAAFEAARDRALATLHQQTATQARTTN